MSDIVNSPNWTGPEIELAVANLQLIQAMEQAESDQLEQNLTTSQTVLEANIKRPPQYPKPIGWNDKMPDPYLELAETAVRNHTNALNVANRRLDRITSVLARKAWAGELLMNAQLTLEIACEQSDDQAIATAQTELKNAIYDQEAADIAIQNAEALYCATQRNNL